MQNNQKVLLLGGGTSSSLLLSLIRGTLGGSGVTVTSVSYNENSTAVVYTADTSAGSVAMRNALDAAFFSFNPSNGELNFLSPPDFENPFGISNNYQVDLVTTAAEGEETTLRVSVHVVDITDNAPTFGATPTTSSVAEDVSDQFFFTPAVFDADPTDTLTFSITGGADAGAFTIDTSTGALKFTNQVDAETDQTVYNVTIGVTDGTFSDTHSLQVTVADAADEVPVFTSSTTASTPENNAAVFYTAQATPDISGSAITYTTTASGVDLDTNTGELNFTAPGADYESATSHVIPITATDAQGLSATINVTVTITDVDDTAPVFTSGAAVSVQENILGTVYTAVAVDASAVTYSLAAGVADNDLFGIDGSSGAVTFNSSPDYENPADANSDNVYSLTVTATDGSGNVSTHNVNITVTDVVVEGTDYSVNGVEASLALGFTTNEYRTANAATTFADAFMGNSPRLTYDPGSASTSQSTMVNSSGEIVWAPHNLLDYSEDFSQWTDHVGVTEDSSTTTDPLGGSTAYTYSGFSGAASNRLSQIFSLAVGVPSTLAIWLKGTAGETIELELDTFGAAANEITFTGSWQLETISNDNPTTGRVRIINRSNSADVVSVWGAHVYRSDLGGMAPVPGADTGFETYVPTNGNEVHLPRVGHHVYNGSAWVNEGLLIESEPRTNLITESTPQSGDLDVSGGSFSYVTCNFTPLSDPGIHFDDPGVASYAYFTPTYTAADYTFSVFVEMDDGNAPVFGSASASSPLNDFALVMEAAATNPLNYTVEHYGGNTYRVSSTVTSSSTTPQNTGVIKYPSNSNRTFKVTGFQLEAGSTPSSYIPTNGSTVIRGGQSLTVPPAEFGWNSDAVSLQMDGRMTYADTGKNTSGGGQGGEIIFHSWLTNFGADYVETVLATGGSRTGEFVAHQRASTGLASEIKVDGVDTYFSPGVNVPFNISSRHGSNFIRGATDGVLTNLVTTPTALPDLSSTDLEIAYDFMGTIGTFRQFAGDIGDDGLEEATS